MRPNKVPSWWNRARYRAYAPVYDWLAWPLEPGRREAMEALAPRPSERTLVLGCGTGLDVRHLPVETPVTLVDAVPSMVRRARRRAAARGMTERARVADARALPFGQNAFDLVLLHSFLSVAAAPVAALRETARVLAPGGRVSIYDKFVPVGTQPSWLRRALNPLAQLFVSDFLCRLEPMLAAAEYEKEAHRRVGLAGVYSATIARPA
jgi:ubiquinone/menaquinone biosynthesis C-methylase UbiE